MPSLLRSLALVAPFAAVACVRTTGLAAQALAARDTTRAAPHASHERAALPRPVPFDSAAWRSDDRTSRFVRHEGTATLVLGGGTALATTAPAWQDGAIEVAIRPEGPRTFAGVVFRADEADDAEVVYLRFPESGRPGAVQYLPRFRGTDGWQLYSGAGFTAPARFDSGWTRLRVEVAGRGAHVLVDGREVLRIPQLVRPAAAGRAGVWALGAARFAHFGVTPAEPVAADGRPHDVRPVRAGTIARWALSPAAPADSGATLAQLATRLPADRGRWEVVEAEPTGLVNVGRHRFKGRAGPDLARNSRDVVFARTELTAEVARTVPLAIAYSDRAVLWVNGTPLWAGDARYRSRGDAYLGVVGDAHEVVFVPLRAGTNELVLLVEDQIGGWGFAARVLDR